MMGPMDMVTPRIVKSFSDKAILMYVSRVSNPISLEKWSESLWTNFSRCGKRHECRYLVGRDGFYGCGEMAR